MLMNSTIILGFNVHELLLGFNAHELLARGTAHRGECQVSELCGLYYREDESGGGCGGGAAGAAIYYSIATRVKNLLLLS